MLQTFAVTVPPGVGPGQQFQASLDGQLTMVFVPHGSGPNSTLLVQIEVSRESTPRRAHSSIAREAPHMSAGTRSRDDVRKEQELNEARRPIDDSLTAIRYKLDELVDNNRAGFHDALRDELQPGFAETFARVRSRLQSKQIPQLVMKIQNWIDEVPIGKLDDWPEEKEAKRHERKVLLKMVERVKENFDAELELLDTLQLLEYLAQPIDLPRVRQLAEAEVNANAAFFQAEQELEQKRQLADRAKQALESAQAAQ